MVNRVRKIFGVIAVLFTFSCGTILYVTIEKDIAAKKVNIEEQGIVSEVENIYVYFPRLPDMKFVGEQFELENSLPIEEKVRRVMNRLVVGPNDDKLLAVIPDNTIINKVKVNNNIAYLDLSDEFIENHPGGSMGEYNTLYSIVNSLTEIEGIRAVDFSIQGKKLETYKGHCEFNEPLYRE